MVKGNEMIVAVLEQLLKMKNLYAIDLLDFYWSSRMQRPDLVGQLSGQGFGHRSGLLRARKGDRDHDDLVRDCGALVLSAGHRRHRRGGEARRHRAPARRRQIGRASCRERV